MRPSCCRARGRVVALSRRSRLSLLPSIGDFLGTALKNPNVSEAVYRDFLPAALADGSYQIVPLPHVVGTGVGAIQDALDLQRRGVSAQKIVVTLGER